MSASEFVYGIAVNFQGEFEQSPAPRVTGSLTPTGSQWVFPFRLAMPALGQLLTVVNVNYMAINFLLLACGYRLQLAGS